EIGRRQFTSNMLVNLARRNQSMLYRQLDIINQLEDKERDPDALADLFKIDHLATRIRRNAENLLVLAGEQPPRTWSAPVALRDVVRAAIAETEDLDRVVFAVDERVSVAGGLVADLTHLLAELTENAVRFSPPETVVTIRARPNRRDEGGHLLTVEDWGVGMPPDDLADANDLLAHPREVEASVSQRLGFHVVARLAARHKIVVSLTATPGSGITAVAILPPALFAVAPAVLDVRPPSPDPAETTRLPVTGNVADPDRAGLDRVESGSAGSDPGGLGPARFGPAGLGPAAFDPAELDHPGKDRAETIRGTDIGPVRHGRPARPVTEPVMPAAERGVSGTGGQWSGWWLPDQSGATNGHAGNGAAPNADGQANAQVNGQVNGHASPVTDGVDKADEPAVADDPGPAPEAAPAVPAPVVVRAVPAPSAAPEPPERGVVDEHPDVGERAGVGERPDLDERPDVGESRDVGKPLKVDVLRNGSKPGADRPAPGVAAPGVAAPGVAASGVPTARTAEVPRIPAPATPPAPSHRPLTAVPHPRVDEPAAPAPEPRALQPGAGGRSLRRRVPQTHLAPELRLAVNGLADTAAPPAADAAASALSRYQASRRAAQASVDISDVRPDGEGARA
ncbi:MAG: ATP-binding protein, partial [Pseudonocardia sediminis]